MKTSKKLVPELRFSEFEGDWKGEKFGEINSILDSLHQTPKEYVENGYSMIRVTDVNDGDLDTDKCLKVSEKYYLEFTKRHTPEKDDIIMSRVGTCGASIKLSTNEPVCLGQNTVLLIPKIDKNYVFSFMKSRFFKNQVDKMIVGSTQKTLSLKDLKKFRINFPQLPEQQKIAAFLTDVDAKITQLTKKKTLLEQYKKGLMQKIFNQELRFKPNVIARRHDEAISQNKTSFPDWEEKKLGEICKIKGRIGYRGYTVKDIVKKGEGAITLSPSNISNGQISYDNSTYISWFKYEESPEIKIENGDVLLVKTASVGKTAYVKNLKEPATINPQIVVLKNIIINSEFLSHQFYHTWIQKQVVSFVGAGAIPNLSQESISKFRIKCPSIEEQTKIANVLSDIDIKIEALNTKIENSKTFKKGLLQQLFV